MPPIVNKIGQKYGKLTVTEFVAVRNRRSIWRCACECGNIVEREGHRLLRQNVHSCGCYVHNKAIVYHFETNKKIKRLKTIWRNMKDRCEKQNRNYYKWYGARGIKVCKIWQNVDNFIEWAWLNGYQDYLTLDRVNNDSHYSPLNCRWATAYQQANNSRRVWPITAFGETKNFTAWTKDARCTVSGPTLKKRILSGMSPEDAMQHPVIPFAQRRWKSLQH